MRPFYIQHSSPSQVGLGKEHFKLIEIKLITKEIIEKLVSDKLITKRKHPYLNIWILNYTPEIQFKKLWTDELMLCRGLVVDSAGKIIARPFKKFFNYKSYI